jgi:glucose-1-phosphate thymidylyltransferase
MKALILAAGYATRLYPLTKDKAKPLLPLGGKPIIDYIVQSIETVSCIDCIYVVTNSKFAPSFESWAAERERGIPIKVVDDGTVSDDDKRGAIGDIKFVLEKECVDDDLIVIGGDNLFELDLGAVVSFFKEKGITIVAYDVEDREAAKRFGIVAVDGSGRVLDFQEKPVEPPSTLAAIAMYLFPRESLGMFQVYADEGNNLDQPGRYIQWLYKRRSVFAYIYKGVWYDIGDLEMYRQADRQIRERMKEQK